MNLHPSGCPVTPSLLRRFLADVENAPCPGDLSACLGRIEQLARQEEPLCLDLSGSWDFCMSAADDAAVSLRSCAPSVVSIDETGLMHALGSGIAKITARCVRAGRSFQAELVVRVNERQAAAVSLSRDGVQFREVCRREWDESHVFDDRLFAFPAQPARFLRITVDWAVMHTGDSNAVSIAGLSLYSEPVVSAVPERPVHPVRCGTPLEKALAALQLPDRLPVTLSTGEQRMADLVWSCGPYRPDAPSLCEITGSVFVEGVADPARPAGARSAQRYDHAAG